MPIPIVTINQSCCTLNWHYVGPNHLCLFPWLCWISYLVCNLASLFLFTIMYIEPVGAIIFACLILYINSYAYPLFLLISAISWVHRKLVKSCYTYDYDAGIGRSLIKLIWHNKYVGIIWIGYNSEWLTCILVLDINGELEC